MSEQRNILTRFFSGQRRWITAGVAALTVSGLVLGGLATPSGASAAELTSDVSFSQWGDVNSVWTTGDLGFGGTNAGTYAEGETVPFLLDVTAAGPGTWAFSICRDYSDGANFGYLSLEAYNTSRSPLTLPLLTSADGPFSGGALAGSVHIDSVDELGAQGTCHAGQRETQVQITVAAGPLGVLTDAYVLWGGHLASPADAGVAVGHGAGAYNGATLAMTMESAKKTLNVKVATAGSLTVQKVVDSGSAQPSDFCFDISPNPAGVVLPLCADASGTATFLGLTGGNYTVTEAAHAGYTFASGSGTNCTVAAGTGLAAIVAAGNTTTNATCVFHNRREQGTLTVNDVLNPGSDPGRFDLNIDGSVAGTGADVGDNGTTGSIVVDAGSHPVGASGAGSTDMADYTASTSCVDSGGHSVAVTGGSVDVADGQNVVCTVTLTPKPVVTTTQPEETTSSTTVTTVAPDTTSSTTDTTVAPDTTSSTTDTTVAPDTTSSTTDTTVAPDTTSSTTDTTTIVDPLPDPPVDPQNDSTTTTTVKPSGPTTSTTFHRTKPTDDDNPGDDDSGNYDPPSSTTTTIKVVVPAAPVDPGTQVAGNTDQAGAPAPEQVLAGEIERPAPPAAPMPAATLPRTGRGIAGEAVAAFALLIAGLALRLTQRRKPAAGQR